MTETLDLSNSRWVFHQDEGSDTICSKSQCKIPGTQSLHYSEKSVRELVISKQNTRVFPADNRLMGRMEDQLVRWKRPPSSHHGTVQVIEGTHPYQQDSISVSQTWSQIKDAFSTRLHQAQVSDLEDEEFEALDMDLGLTIGQADERRPCDAPTAVTTKAVPVTLQLPAKTDDLTIHSQYSYQYPIPNYYLPPSQRDENQDSEESASCFHWFCSPY